MKGLNSATVGEGGCAFFFSPLFSSEIQSRIFKKKIIKKKGKKWKHRKLNILNEIILMRKVVSIQ